MEPFCNLFIERPSYGSKVDQEPMTEQLGRRNWNWFKHTLRSNHESTAEQALQWTSQGHRGRGRPRNTISRRGWLTLSADFRGKTVSPTNHCRCESSRVIALSCGIKISAVHHLVLSQFMCVTDRQMDGQTNRITTPKTALAYAGAANMHLNLD